MVKHANCRYYFIKRVYIISYVDFIRESQMVRLADALKLVASDIEYIEHERPRLAMGLNIAVTGNIYIAIAVVSNVKKVFGLIWLLFSPKTTQTLNDSLLTRFFLPFFEKRILTVNL